MSSVGCHAVPARLQLPQVTLCAVTSVNVQATLRALRTSLDQIAFGACKLFTDATIDDLPPEITVVRIPRLRSGAAYSEFILSALGDHVATSHCMVVQWDGHPVSIDRWTPAFLDYDYIGAGWPQFDDGHDVGNGGFSLRSRRLMQACQDDGFLRSHPEDVAICRLSRARLEEQGMRFAPRSLADRFSAERAGDPRHSFGYHGVFNMPRAIGIDRFWRVYRELDHRDSVWHDFRGILLEAGWRSRRFGEAARMCWDRLIAARSG